MTMENRAPDRKEASKSVRRILRRDWTPLFLICVMILLWAVLHALIGGSFYGPNRYNSYTRQAMAWRQGMTHLPGNAAHLELAVYEGEYYVSFPPLPSVILWPLTFLFGMNTPDNLLVKLYALGACLMMYGALKRMGWQKAPAAVFAFLICFASSLLPLTLDGAVWYHAQMLAFFLTVAAVCLMTSDRPARALLCYALSVACRPFNALYALPLFFCYSRARRRDGASWKSIGSALLPGVTLGLCVASALAVYNAMRFGNPLEFGHNYLPEFTREGQVQFSLAHVGKNLKTYLWGLPFSLTNGQWTMQRFGYSMLLACPTVTLMLGWAAADLFKRRMRWEKAVVLFTCLAHIFFLLFHRTFGGLQLGARYVVDAVPYTFYYLLLTPEKKKPRWFELAFLVLVLLFTCWGATQVHIKPS